MSLDEIPEPTDEELAEMEAALDQGDEYWDDLLDAFFEFDIDDLPEEHAS